MVRFNARDLAATCLIVVAIADHVMADDAAADKQAKEIYGQLFKAIKAKDLDAAMKLVDVPWVGLGKKDVVKDEKELKKRLKEFLDSIEDPSELKLKIDGVMTYPKFLELVREKGKNREDILKLLDELKLDERDRVIVENAATTLIRIRDGKAKVVGIIE